MSFFSSFSFSFPFSSPSSVSPFSSSFLLSSSASPSSSSFSSCCCQLSSHFQEIIWSLIEWNYPSFDLEYEELDEHVPHHHSSPLLPLIIITIDFRSPSLPFSFSSRRCWNNKFSQSIPDFGGMSALTDLYPLPHPLPFFLLSLPSFSHLTRQCGSAFLPQSTLPAGLSKLTSLTTLYSFSFSFPSFS